MQETCSRSLLNSTWKHLSWIHITSMPSQTSVLSTWEDKNIQNAFSILIWHYQWLTTFSLTPKSFNGIIHSRLSFFRGDPNVWKFRRSMKNQKLIWIKHNFLILKIQSSELLLSVFKISWIQLNSMNTEPKAMISWNKRSSQMQWSITTNALKSQERPQHLTMLQSTLTRLPVFLVLRNTTRLLPSAMMRWDW